MCSYLFLILLSFACFALFTGVIIQFCVILNDFCYLVLDTAD